MTAPAADVLIVGAGPVGMTLALDLAQRGVEVLLVEQHAADAAPIMRCNHVSARSMEIFRHLGVADQVRQAGLPGSYPHDVSFMTSVDGYELGRIVIPSRDDRFLDGDYADAGWPTAEPPHRCNQMYFEPILRERVHATPGIHAVYDTEITEITQDDDGATALGVDRSSGRRVSFRAQYLVGCDGGASRVRSNIGSTFEGDAVISKSRSVRVRAADVLKGRTTKPSWMTWVINPRVPGLCNVMAINGSDMWTFSFTFSAREEGFEDFADFDIDTALTMAVGRPFDYEVLRVDDWYGRRLVASIFGQGRIFICGDAAHIWAPFAGYGMNAGIGDAHSLAWQLSGVLAGWGGRGLLDAYEAERRAVTNQVSQHVAKVAADNLSADYLRSKPAKLEHDTPDGEKLRAQVGSVLVEVNTAQFACSGLNFGTHYDQSPAIDYDGEVAPPYELGAYSPSTVPGCRAPHLDLSADTTLFDAAGNDFALVRSDLGVDVSSLTAAAAERGVPFTVIDIAGVPGAEVYDHALVLMRPDQHIGWRGHRDPTDAARVIDLVCGAWSSTR